MSNPDESNRRPHGIINNAFEYWRVCEYCDGTGKLVKKEPCLECDGDGWVWNSHGFPAECPCCEGNLSIENTEDCPHCDGEGMSWQLEVDE